MEIQEAMKLTFGTLTVMTREKWVTETKKNGAFFAVKPIDDFSCISACENDPNGLRVCPRWNPTPEDILANDWKLVSDTFFGFYEDDWDKLVAAALRSNVELYKDTAFEAFGLRRCDYAES